MTDDGLALRALISIVLEGNIDWEGYPPPPKTYSTYLENLQLLEPVLHQLLDLARVLLALVLAKGVSCSALGVLAEVVCAELATLS